MKTSQIITYAVVLLIGGAIGYFIGASSGKSGAGEPSAAVSPATPEPGAADAPGEGTAQQPEAPGSTSTTAASSETTAPAPTGSLPDGELCFTGNELKNKLTQYAEQIEAQKLDYVPAKMQDCSGIFFKLIEQFAKKRCSEYKYPSPNSERPARMIAKWYHDNNNFSFIEDVMQSRNLIKPGTVLFYGKPGESYHNMTVDRMTGPSGKIHHIGVVTDVEKDAQGNVIRYVLYHGQTYGKTAGRTHNHTAKGGSRQNYPVFGFGSEQLVAISYLFTPG